MSANYNATRTTGVTGQYCGSAVGAKEPIAHPVCDELYAGKYCKNKEHQTVFAGGTL